MGFRVPFPWMWTFNIEWLSPFIRSSMYSNIQLYAWHGRPLMPVDSWSWWWHWWADNRWKRRNQPRTTGISPANRVIKKQTWWGCQLLKWWPCFTSSSRRRVSRSRSIWQTNRLWRWLMDCRVVPSHTSNLIVRIVAKVRFHTLLLVACINPTFNNGCANSQPCRTMLAHFWCWSPRYR